MNISPGNAAFVSLFVPGLAHFLQQKPVRGALALVSCVALFFAGYAMIGGRLWHVVWFPPFEMAAPVFKVFPLNLWPEWFNLGCSMLAAALQQSHTDPLVQANMLRLQRVPVDGEHLAFFLTSASGLISFLWAADAHYLSRQRASETGGKPLTPRKNPALMAFWSWLLPGSGHWQLGQKDKGMLMGGAIVGLFLLAMLFSEGHAVDRQHSPAYWIGQFPFGGGMLFASLVTAPMMLEGAIPPDIDLGITLALVAGVMNLVVMVDAYTVAETSGEPAAAVGPEPEQEAAGRSPAGDGGAA